MVPPGASLLFLLILLTAGRATSAAANNKPQLQQLVQSTCNSTTYYDVCVAALAADPSSSTAVDVRGLCAIAASAAATNASAAGTSVLASAAAYQSQVPERAALLRACAARYADARQALASAQEAIKEEAYDYAFVHVSAAAEYPTMCRALFRRTQTPRGYGYPSELVRREEGLRRLCTVVLDIISLLVP
ncbi:pectinesterase inhibitor 28-like [Oryza brachyantha]|uniref:Pectinesterase inhibitor domain-containing protein n=1 Tax=Oryza brachyantha TaxID=4533 RepID=J3M319_ORYBR|nr:pectinesterase inhibitor 28-like [Oryza brachyantha]